MKRKLIELEGKLYDYLYHYQHTWHGKVVASVLNFIYSWHYNLFRRGICALIGCDITTTRPWNTPPGLYESWCDRCGEWEQTGLPSDKGFFSGWYPIKDFIKALKGE